MRVLVLGKTGQVARALAATVPKGVEVEFLGRDVAELSQPDVIGALVLSRRPELVINAAAYTATDRAEAEPELAMLINGEAPGAMAKACEQLHVPLIHYSTDYVFFGNDEKPWGEDDAPSAVSVYGRSKLLGEQLIAKNLRQHLILRTSWVFDSEGKNFLKTILRVAKEKDELRVVSDQVGAPTWAHDIATATWRIAQAVVKPGFSEWGIFHLTSTGHASWFDFAKEIVSTAQLSGLDLKVKNIVPISTSENPSVVARPLNSRLDGAKLKRVFNMELPNWKNSVQSCVQAVLKKELSS